MSSKTAAYASLGVTLLIALVACSSADEGRPPAGSGSGPTSGAGGGGNDTSGEGGVTLVDGGIVTDGGDGGACSGVAQKGESVSEMMLAGDPPPALGGAITPGTYTLSELDSYGPLASTDGGTVGALTGVVGRATVVVTATSITVLGARGTTTAPLPADTFSASTYTVVGTSLQTKTLCPTAGAAATVPFSAVGGGLALFVGTKQRELYTLQ